MNKKIIALIFFTIIGALAFMNNRNIKYYHFNKELTFTKKGWKGNLMLDNQFVNQDKKKPQNFTTFIKWRLSTNPFKKEKKNEIYSLKIREDNSFINSSKDGIQWLGHSSFIIRLNGVTITTDPVYFPMTGVKRLSKMPLSPDKITPIDYLLITHGHRDHFDRKSFKIIAKKNPNMIALIPLKFTPLIGKKVKSQEAGWYQRYKTNSQITIDFVPAFHWHKRGITDFNNILWGSFIIRSKNKTIFFCGDSSYGPHFKEIGKLYGPIDICIMPIGAYRPSYMMKDSHMTPEESYKAFKDLKGKIMIPMHYGTYDLADELRGEPEKRIRVLGKKNPGTVKIISPGETFTL